MSLTTPVLHVLPNGVHGTLPDGTHRLRLTLLLLPGPPAGPAAGPATWQLAQWPSQRVVWLDGLIGKQRKVTLHKQRTTRANALPAARSATRRDPSRRANAA